MLPPTVHDTTASHAGGIGHLDTDTAAPAEGDAEQRWLHVPDGVLWVRSQPSSGTFCANQGQVGELVWVAPMISAKTRESSLVD